MNSLTADKIAIDTNVFEHLFKIVKSILDDRVDQIFVYVAMQTGRVLVTNDRTTILHGAENTPKSKALKARLMKETKKHRQPGCDLITSREAEVRLDRHDQIS